MVSIRLSCIYARKDNYTQQQLSSHLERLHLQKHLDDVHFMEVSEEAFAERRYTQEEREADMYLVLLSPHLLASPFIHSAYLKKLYSAHQHRQIKLVPLVLSDGDYGKTSLGRIERLNANQEPVKNVRELSLEANLTLLTDELTELIIDWRDQKESLTERWQEAESAGELIYFVNFIKDYPHSVYTPQARKIYNELKEQELWQTAKSVDTVHTYYLYLRDAPLQHTRVDAIKRISEIEYDESIAKADAMQSSSLPLLFDYLVRFPKSKSLGEIRSKVEQLEKDRVNHLDEGEYIQSEAYYLQHLAYEKLDKDELLSMRLLLNYTLSLIKRSKRVLLEITNTQASLGLIGVFGVVVFGYSLVPLIDYALVGTFGFRPFLTFIFCILGLFLAIRAYTGYLIAAKDREFCGHIRTSLMRSLVTIKVSAIDHDQRALFQETSSLMRIEKAYRRIMNTSFLSYLFDRSTKGSKKQAAVIRKLPLPLGG